jgi:cleavage and polyadenylation specificity factor subunit 1
MQCYTELTPPTAVTHSLSLPFISADSNNLIVAKTSLLQIFTPKIITFELEGTTNGEGQSARKNSITDRIPKDEDGEEASFLGDVPLLRAERGTKTKLVLVAEYTLSGTITSLARIKTESSKSGGEALLVGFRDAKLSLVEWDPERPGLSTISIHYYEQDELQGSPWAPSLSSCVNYLSVDPRSRCAALKFGSRNLAILPFRQEDEDVLMDDWDEDLDGPRPEKEVTKITNGDSSKESTPYSSSFVLRLSYLNPNLIYPIHLAFLYEYREPTFGILSSRMSSSASLLHERKDQLSYMVFTLDLHQKASTTILSVNGLPYDLYKIIPLPPPVGGALLVGGNELIHIDQGGKANGIGVNMFAKQCTSFTLTDHSDLEMRLEGCTIELLSIENGEMLVILHNGSLAILSFIMDGRSVSGLSIRKVSDEKGGSIISAGPSSASALGSNALFLGSENANSVVIGWNQKSSQQGRRKSRLELPDGADEAFLEEIEDEEDDDADDDLYGDSTAVTQAMTNGDSKGDSANSKAGDYVFRIHDALENIAPITGATFGKSSFYANDEEKDNAEGVTSDLELVAASGKDGAGALAIIHRNIQPKVIGRFEFPEARGIWTVSAKRPPPKGLPVDKEKTEMSGDFGVEAQYDKLMIVSKAFEDGAEQSDVYALTPAGFEALIGTEFEPAAGSTIEAGTLGNGMRVIQVLKSEVRSYDGGKSSFSFLKPLLSAVGRNCWNFKAEYTPMAHRGYISIMFYLFLLSEALFWNVSMSYSINESVLSTTLYICHLPRRVMPRSGIDVERKAD